MKVVPTNTHKIQEEQIQELLEACTNTRDTFLLSLIYESGMRISEVLGLWIEDFSLDRGTIEIKNRGDLENGVRLKSLNAPRIIVISNNIMNMFIEYIAKYHDDYVDTNHVFIKLTGDNKNQPMSYPDVDALFKRLKKRTGIHATSNMLRYRLPTEKNQRRVDASSKKYRGSKSICKKEK